MKKSKLTAIADILLIFLSFFMLVFAILSDRYYTIYKQTYDYALSNNGILPLLNIETVNFKCRKNYSPLFTYSYFGSSEGCYLPLLRLIKTIPCSDERLKKLKPAIEIPELDRDDFHMWRNVTLCGKRYMPGQNEFKYIESHKTCPGGFKECGYTDMFKDKMCINATECPITYIAFDEDISKYDLKKFKTLQVTDGKYLVYSREPNYESYIPIDFSIGEDVPCILPDRHNFISKPYPLLKNKDKLGCDNHLKGNKTEGHIDYEDHRYIKLDSIPTTEFFNRNEGGFINLLPETTSWKRNKTSVMNLYFRTRIRINNECVTDENRIHYKVAIDTIKIRLFTMVLLNLANVILVCAFIAILSMTKVVRKIQNIIVGFIKILYSLVFISINTYFSASIFTMSHVVFERMKTVRNLHCMDKTSLFSMNEIYGANGFLDDWEIMNNLAFYSCIPYSILIFIQLVRYSVKLYYRIRNKKVTETQIALKMIDKSYTIN
jgi:hypothetical protein